ncbi:MAG TPA: branched-chain-amino-acid transaminase [Kofleriaceae bacterium]|jgi:branched-chain amino acid aminotransferase|nr:branched-chain-amino-acid transaminase [Kofleriaceae bacterium]
MKIWIGGRIVNEGEATVSVSDHGVLYGDGVFEGMRVIHGRVFRIERHLARLAFGAKALHLQLPHTLAEIRQLTEDTVRAFGEKEAYIRLVVTRGVGPLGVDPTTCPTPTLYCIVGGIKLFTEEQRERGLDMITSSYRRPNADVLDVRVKSLNYLGSVLAKLEARQRQADEALLLNSNGHIAEASVANIFALRGRELLTPPASDGCLEGINRGVVLELAPQLGLVPIERSIGRADLFAADEVFLTGSGAGIVAVRGLDGRVLGDGKRGPMTARLAEMHRALAGSEGTSLF